MRKLVSISIPPSKRSLRVGSNVVGGTCPVVVVGTDVKENIILEARALMKCVERLCKGVYGTKCRQLVHGDITALVLTQCRWRSRLFQLIVILRRAAAYILARLCQGG